MAGGRLLHLAVGLQLLRGVVRLPLDGHPQRHHLHPLLLPRPPQLLLPQVLLPPRRYYTSLAINLGLLLFLLHKLYLFENMVVTSTAALLEVIAMCLLKATQWLHITRHYYFLVVLLPLAVEVVSKVDVGLSLAGASGRLLCMQVLFASQEAGYLITLIKSYFMISVYAT